MLRHANQRIRIEKKEKHVSLRGNNICGGNRSQGGLLVRDVLKGL